MIRFAGTFQSVPPIRFAGRKAEVAPVLMERLATELDGKPEIVYQASDNPGDEILISRTDQGDVEFCFMSTNRTIVVDADGEIEAATYVAGEQGPPRGLDLSLAKSVVESFLSIFFEDPHPQRPSPPPPAEELDDQGTFEFQ